MKREFIDYLNDILESVNALEEFVKGLKQSDFTQDKKTVFASIRCFEVIGEAVKKIPNSIKSKYPDIPWRTIAGMRDKLIHEYFGVDKKVLWMSIKEDMPKLKQQIEKVIRE